MCARVGVEQRRDCLVVCEGEGGGKEGLLGCVRGWGWSEGGAAWLGCLARTAQTLNPSP